MILWNQSIWIMVSQYSKKLLQFLYLFLLMHRVSGTTYVSQPQISTWNKNIIKLESDSVEVFILTLLPTLPSHDSSFPFFLLGHCIHHLYPHHVAVDYRGWFKFESLSTFAGLSCESLAMVLHLPVNSICCSLPSQWIIEILLDFLLPGHFQSSMPSGFRFHVKMLLYEHSNQIVSLVREKSLTRLSKFPQL